MEYSLNSLSMVVRNESLGSDIYRLTVNGPQIAKQALPGQFVMVQTAPGQDPLLRRPFSIHQVFDNGNIQILFKVVGRGTRIIANLKEGDSLSVLGPLGKGFRAVSPDSNICMVGGGMGIAPLLFLGKWLLNNGLTGKLVALLGARSAEEVNQLADDFNRLNINTAIATDDGSLGHHGLVTDLMKTELKSNEKWQVLTCGPYPMMRGVVAICKELSYPCQVSMETMMACGMGACLGCAISKPNDLNSYQHVCKDGPVFDMSEIIWK